MPRDTPGHLCAEWAPYPRLLVFLNAVNRPWFVQVIEPGLPRTLKLPRWITAGWLAAVAAVAPAIERLPVEDFAREPTITRARLSPDGKRLAYVHDYRERSTLHVFNLETNKLSRLDLGEAALANDATKAVGDFSWIGDQRLAVTTTVWDSFYGVIAVNWDGRSSVPISGYEDNRLSVSGAKLLAREVIHWFNDQDQTILMLDRHEAGGGNPREPDILRVDTVTGEAHTELKNPGNVVHWGLDFDGVVRLGIIAQGEQTGAIYRENANVPWRTLLPLAGRSGGMRLLGFDAAGDRMFVAALNPEKRWAVYPLDPVTGALGDALLADPVYDIVPERLGEAGGVGLASPIFSRKKQTLVGIRYCTEAPRIQWFDKEYASYQAAMDRALPDTVNLLAGVSRDEQRLLWFSFSDQNPGAYYLLDLAKHKMKPLTARMNWIKPAQMAPMLSAKYTARDGLVIHGYLTLPVGCQPKNLPLVVLVHGGPWVRDTWGFDPLVQLLANRGYAVLQVNYRGSPGYGEELFRKARRQIGREIQDDIEDATRWAIASGLADPQRIAIMGASYGGYSALFGLGHNPELYSCGIALAAVTDWPAIFDDRRGDPAYKSANEHWRREIGDPDKDGAVLGSISPVNFAEKITAPVLIIQGKEDRTVPPEQAKVMIAALNQTGRKPESLFISDLGHGYGNEKQRLQIYKAIVAFLEKNLGSDRR